MNWSENRFLIAGIVAIVLGFVLLAALRSEVMAPLLLVTGYCILVPAHLWIRYRRDGGE